MSEATADYALARFVQLLAGMPRPDALAEALARGPLVTLGTRSVALWLAVEGDELRAISTYGLAFEGVERYQSVPIAVDLPNTRCYRENRTVAYPLDRMVTDFRPLALSPELWQGLAARLPGGMGLNAPIAVEGAPVGVLSVLCEGRDSWSPDDYALLEGTAAALALWVTNPGSGVADLRLRRQPPATLRLTDRQVKVLELVETGETNPRIAALLGFSESTVKQEVQRILRLLRVDDRMSAVARAREAGLL